MAFNPNDPDNLRGTTALGQGRPAPVPKAAVSLTQAASNADSGTAPAAPQVPPAVPATIAVPSPSTPTPTPASPNTGLFKAADDDVGRAVTDAASDTSPLVRQARQAGLDAANSRGLLNTSIAAGASQAEAYKVALPIGQQQAQQAATRNLSAQQFGENLALGNQAQTSAEKIASAAQAGETLRTGLGIASQERLGQLSASTQTNIANLQIGASDRQQANDIVAKAALQAGQIKNDQDLARLQAQTQQAIAQMNIDASSKQQLTDLASREIMQQRDIANSQATVDKQLASNQALAGLDIQTRTAIANLDSATQQKIAQMNVIANQQDKAVAAAASYTSIYQNMVDTITANKDIPAATRDAYLSNAKAVLDSGIRLVEAMYNVDLNWPGVATVTGTQPTPVVSTGNKTQDKANAAAATQAAANYGSGGGLLTGGPVRVQVPTK